MKIAIDTDVLLDVLVKREPFFAQSRAVLRRVADGKAAGAVTSGAIADVCAVLQKHLERGAAAKALSDLLSLVDVLPATKARCQEALTLPMERYEDALLASCARKWGAGCIVTRNEKRFSHSQVRAISPEAFLKEYPPNG